MRRGMLIPATVVLTLGAAFGVLMLGYATGELYIDDPDPDPPVPHAWLWVAEGAGAAALVLALVGAVRDHWVWLLGAVPLAALTLLGLLLLATA